MTGASTSPAAPTATPPRSCVTCRQRRVRCDKQNPCSNCQRNSIECVVPPSGRVPRKADSNGSSARQSKAEQTERELVLMDRLRKLEATVGRLSSNIQLQQGAVDDDSQGHSRNDPNRGNLAASTSSFNGLDFSGGQTDSLPHESIRNSFYVSDAFWERLNKKLDSVRKDALDSAPDNEDELNTSNLPQVQMPMPEAFGFAGSHRGFMFGFNADDVLLHSYHPSMGHAELLWSTYRENIEPVVKILHIPTIECLLLQARQCPTSLTPQEESLVFAIYYSALIATEPDEVPSRFGETVDALLTRYRFALEVSLARANFLSTSSLPVLQAITLFLTTVRRVDDSLFCWTLTGLVIRIAKGMGVHRDGSNLGMSLFETEIRRRVWWAILVLDHRSSEEAGSDLIVTEDDFDTQKPTNVNEADIYPEMTVAPIPRDGHTDTAAALARYEVLGMVWRFPRELSGGDLGLDLASCERLMMEAYERAQRRYLNQFADQADPLWSAVSLVVKIIVTKACLGLYESKISPKEDSGTEAYLHDPIRDRIFVTAIETVELGNLLYTGNEYRRFRWMFMTYTNWHAIAFNLIEIARRPWSAVVERSWESVEDFDRNPVGLRKGSDNAAILVPLRGLRERAKKHRKAELMRLRMDPEACLQLDADERSSPAAARFSHVPGSEGRMDTIRAKWWALVQPIHI